MIEVVHAYRERVISREDLFVALARNSCDEDWDRAISSLRKDEQDSFLEWARPLLTGETTLIISAGRPAVDESQLESLRVRLKEPGCVLNKGSSSS